jgi:hypothetical protein
MEVVYPRCAGLDVHKKLIHPRAAAHRSFCLTRVTQPLPVGNVPTSKS